LIPEDIAILNPVGEGRSEANRDPYLPEPAGRISIMSGMLGGFFVIAGTLKEYLMNLLLIVVGVLLVVYSIYSFASSFSGSFFSSLILN